MVNAQVTSNPAQVHPIHVQLQCFLAHRFWIDPGFLFWGVLDLTEHATIALAAAIGFSGTILPFGSVTFWTFIHAEILAYLAQVLATPLPTPKNTSTSGGV
jgi:hypothetical protein